MYGTQLKADGVYYVYLRKSRADLELEKVKKFDALKQHEKLIKERVKDLGIRISKTYKEIVSGETIQDRPEMQKLLKEVETGYIDGVIVVEVARLSRGDTKDQGVIAQTFKYTNTLIITLDKIFDPNKEEDEEYFEFNLYMSRREYKTINRRMQRGKLASILEGKYCGSKQPFGYKRVKIKSGKGYTLEPKEDEVEILKQIFEKRANGTGFYMICNWLNTLDIKPVRSDVWTPSTVEDMVSNPIYIGKIRWNNSKTEKKISNGIMVKTRKKSKMEDLILVEGLHPALIDEKVFNEANNIKAKKVNTKHKLDERNPLAGLIKCKDCGRTMQRRPYSVKYNYKTKARKYDFNKDELRLLLRDSKEKLGFTARDISKIMGVSFNTSSRWFSSSINKFSIPKSECWYRLKELLNITENKFDKPLTEFIDRSYCVHDDTFLCPKAHCENIGSLLSLVEERVVKKTLEYLIEQENMLSVYKSSKKVEGNVEVELYKKELENKNKQLKKSYELVEKGIYTATEFVERTKVIKSEIETLEKEIKKFKTIISDEERNKLIPNLKSTMENYYKIKDVKIKNGILKSIISHIDYKKEKGGKKYEDSFEINIHYKI